MLGKRVKHNTVESLILKKEDNQKRWLREVTIMGIMAFKKQTNKKLHIGSLMVSRHLCTKLNPLSLISVL